MNNQNIPRGKGSQHLPRKNIRLTARIRSIQDRAAEYDGRVVRVGSLLLFSTDTGDAWILDPADQLAARLACGGDPLAVRIEEHEDNYAIGWQGRYRIEGDLFVYEENDKLRQIAIFGYPTSKLLGLSS